MQRYLLNKAHSAFDTKQKIQRYLSGTCLKILSFVEGGGGGS